MSNRFALTLIAAALVLPAVPAAAQQPQPLAAILARRDAPARLKDLTPAWKRFVLSGPKDSGSGGLAGLASGFLGALTGGALSKLDAPVASFTQGETVTLGTETFLVVYRPQVQRLDLGTLAALGEEGGDKKLPEPQKVTAETPLVLSLINLRTVDSLSDLRPFDLQFELAEAEKAYATEKKLTDSIGSRMAPDVQTEPEPATPAPAPKKPAPKKRAGNRRA